MNKNLVLAVVLSSIVYIVWFTYVTPPQKPQPDQKAQTAEAEIADRRPTTFQETAENILPAKANTASKTAKTRISESLILETAKARILVDSVTGAIREIIYQGPISPVNLIPEGGEGFLSCLEGLDYSVIKKDRNSVFLGADLSRQIRLVKKLSFSTENGFNWMELEFRNNSGADQEIAPFDISIGPGLGTVANEEKENPRIWQANYTFQEKGKKHPTLVKLKGSKNSDYWGWAGINNRYFLFAVINDGASFSGITYEDKKIKDNNAPFISLVTKPFRIGPGETRSIKFRFYSGPKDYELLKKLGEGLDRSVDFGFFAPLAKIANSALQYFYRTTGNYGLAIIILSIVLQILVFPLGLKSYKAMAVMKKIQPEIQALQSKYKNDPKRLNMEMMNLYKKHGANPLSGCWPMLLQIPVFFALFTTLRNSWNLHGAAFALWIKDLSAPDTLFGHIPVLGMPLGPLPLIMGALMFVQQQMSPAPAGDPTQAKIMKWMPALFIFMFLSFPSGLVIYWTINSLFSIGQTLYLKKAK